MTDRNCSAAIHNTPDSLPELGVCPLLINNCSALLIYLLFFFTTDISTHSVAKNGKITFMCDVDPFPTGSVSGIMH